MKERNKNNQNWSVDMAGSFGRAANRIFDLIVLSILQMLLLSIGGT